MTSKKIALKVDNLSKCYRIGLMDKIHDSFTSAIYEFIKSPLKNYRKYRSLYKFDDINFESRQNGVSDPTGIIWALRDVSFELQRGEVLGIIGKNGAGKSTLLKILSRITNPTAGRAETHGRISSLLEVGTGFHPELTGRENVYLNGTILGMRKKEVDLKFDEIVDFSGVEEFIDTPVKRYSSGMRVRLAFAVAAHLEPEILIIDEVLAVGDAQFQKKCLNKMEDIGQKGRTVLFVSHNMAAVTRLCDRAILLDNGLVVKDGPSHQVVRSYLNSDSGTSAAREWPDLANAPGGDVARLCAVRAINEDKQILESFDIRRPIGIEMEYEVLKSGNRLFPYHHFFNEEGVWVFCANHNDPQWRGRPHGAGRYKSTAWIPGNLLNEGMLFVNSGLITLDPNIGQFYERAVVAFQVVENDNGPDSARGDWTGPIRGVVRPALQWQTEHISAEGENSQK